MSGYEHTMRTLCKSARGVITLLILAMISNPSLGQTFDIVKETKILPKVDSLQNYDCLSKLDINSDSNQVLCENGSFVLGILVPDQIILKTNKTKNGFQNFTSEYLNGQTFLKCRLTNHYEQLCSDTLKSFYSNGMSYYTMAYCKNENKIKIWEEVLDSNGNLKRQFRNLTDSTFVETQFYGNGNKMSQSYFVYRMIDNRGTWVQVDTVKHWYDNGQLSSVTIMNRGKNQIQAWYENGNPSMLGHYIDFPLYWVGQKVEYFENGMVASLSNFKNGNEKSEANIPHGVWTYYDESGLLLKTEIYEDGIRLSETKNILPMSK